MYEDLSRIYIDQLDKLELETKNKPAGDNRAFSLQKIEYVRTRVCKMDALIGEGKLDLVGRISEEIHKLLLQF